MEEYGGFERDVYACCWMFCVCESVEWSRSCTDRLLRTIEDFLICNFVVQFLVALFFDSQ